MKRILLFICILLFLTGCSSSGKEQPGNTDRYENLIEMIRDHEVFLQTSNYFDISADMAMIDGGYRYYITIDNPRLAMYDIEMMAIEKDVDYSSTMAANVGVFEDTEYKMVPNQSNPAQGFVKGIVASGVSKSPSTTLYVFVQFRNSDYSQTHAEYFELPVSYGEE